MQGYAKDQVTGSLFLFINFSPEIFWDFLRSRTWLIQEMAENYKAFLGYSQKSSLKPSDVQHIGEIRDLREDSFVDLILHLYLHFTWLSVKKHQGTIFEMILVCVTCMLVAQINTRTRQVEVFFKTYLLLFVVESSHVYEIPLASENQLGLFVCFPHFSLLPSFLAVIFHLFLKSIQK